MTDEKALTKRGTPGGLIFRGNLVPQERERAEALVRVGFDAGMHLALYQGRVTITIDGLYWWARQGCSQPAEFRIISEPIVGRELRDAYGIEEKEIGVIARLYVQGQAEPSCSGFGQASKDPQHPTQRGSAVEADHPYRMAEKRAEAQVLRKFRPIGVEVLTPEEVAEMPRGGPVLGTEGEPPPDADVKPRPRGSAETVTSGKGAPLRAVPTIAESMATPGWSAPEPPAKPRETVPPTEAEPLGDSPAGGRPPAGQPPCTQAQLTFLAKLGQGLGWEEDRLIYEASERKIAHVAELNRLTIAQASQLIEALKKQKKPTA